MSNYTPTHCFPEHEGDAGVSLMNCRFPRAFHEAAAVDVRLKVEHVACKVLAKSYKDKSMNVAFV